MSKLIVSVWLCFLMLGCLIFVAQDRYLYTFYNIWPADWLYANSIFAHVICMLGMYLGGAVFYKRHSNAPKLIEGIREIASSSEQPIFISCATLVVVMAVALYTYTYGLGGLTYRGYYIADGGSAITALANLSMIVGLFLSAFLVCSSRLGVRFVGLFLSAVVVTLSFSIGSRFTVLSLVLISLLVLSNINIHVIFKIAIASLIAALAVPLLHVLLSFRDANVYGFIPYLSAISSGFASISDNDYQGVWQILMNLSFGIPVTELTIQTSSANYQSFFVSVNPLPGSYAGWDDLFQTRRISEEIPYSAFGELYAVSPVVCFLYMFLVGYLIELTFKEISAMSGILKNAFFCVVFALSFLFLLQSPQYNLRSVTRLFYYILFFLFVVNYISSNKLRKF